MNNIAGDFFSNEQMEIEYINELTRIAYDRTADKYHQHFRNEMEQKEYDRIILRGFSDLLVKGSKICDAGCGPSAQIGKYIADMGHHVTGIDISPKCIEIARKNNNGIAFEVMDMSQTTFRDGTFDAIISFYSIIYTPKPFVGKIFSEFNRILKPGGKLLVVVKKGNDEGIIDNEWYEGNKVYFTHFEEGEITGYLVNSGFGLDRLDTRKPYDFEFPVERIYAIATKTGNNIAGGER